MQQIGLTYMGPLTSIYFLFFAGLPGILIYVQMECLKNILWTIYYMLLDFDWSKYKSISE